MTTMKAQKEWPQPRFYLQNRFSSINDKKVHFQSTITTSSSRTITLPRSKVSFPIPSQVERLTSIVIATLPISTQSIHPHIYIFTTHGKKIHDARIPPTLCIPDIDTDIDEPLLRQEIIFRARINLSQRNTSIFCLKLFISTIKSLFTNKDIGTAMMPRGISISSHIIPTSKIPT